MTIISERLQHLRLTHGYTVIQESQNVVAYTINLLKMNQKFQEGN